MPSTPVESSVKDGCLVLTIKEAQLRGDPLAESLRSEFFKAVDATGSRNVIVDLGNVEMFTSVAFRPLLSLRRKLHDADGRLILCGMSPMVADVFRVTRLISTGSPSSAPFESQPNLEAALAAMKSEGIRA